MNLVWEKYRSSKPLPPLATWGLFKTQRKRKNRFHSVVKIPTSHYQTTKEHGAKDGTFQKSAQNTDDSTEFACFSLQKEPDWIQNSQVTKSTFRNVKIVDLWSGENGSALSERWQTQPKVPWFLTLKLLSFNAWTNCGQEEACNLHLWQNTTFLLRKANLFGKIRDLPLQGYNPDLGFPWTNFWRLRLEWICSSTPAQTMRL